MNDAMNRSPGPHLGRVRCGARQRGAVALIVGFSLVALVGAAGLAVDLARLYTNKSELQSAADACALAASAELTCPAGIAGCLTNARQAGKFAALKNKSDFQAAAVVIADADVRFSANFVPNANYLAAGAPADSRYGMCIARSSSIGTWFLGVLGIASNLVTAQAVASLQPSASGAGAGGACPGAPIGACPPAGGGAYAIGDWVVANATGSGTATDLAGPKGIYGAAIKGTFRWVDWDYPGGGANEVRDRLAGTTTTCGISRGSTNIAEEGVKQGAKDAWNSRFGIYGNGVNGYNVNNAPPDRTGYSYPTKVGSVPYIPVGSSAYADFRARQSSFAPFQGQNGVAGTYDSQGPGNPQVGGQASTSAEHQSHGTNRRLIAIPIVNGCAGAGSPVTVVSMACFLMLNPMANGSNGDVFMEYRGAADAPNSPCSSGGAPGGGAGGGGGGGGGALVPTLVQ